MSTKDLLSKIQVKTPCEADWDAMIGNDRMRFCEHCNLSVHDLSQMTRKHVLRLVTKSNGRLCVRYRLRPDGSMITKAVPQQLVRITRRASRIAAGAFSATLSLSSAVANPSNAAFNMSGSSVAFASQDPARQVYSRGAIMGRITDANGAAIAGATIWLSREDTNLSLITSSNAEGEYLFGELERGVYSLRIEASGFAPADLDTVYLFSRANERLDKQLRVATIEDLTDEVRAPGAETVTVGVVVIEGPAEPLVKAAHQDDLQDVLTLLTRENVNVRDKATGTTALEHAVRNGNREMLQALVSAGADVNSRNESKETALMMLGEEGTSDMVWDLIHGGAKVDHHDCDGDTALIASAMVKNVSVLATLLQAGAKVNAKNNEGQTALMLAARENLVKNVKALIAAGADLNARDKEGKTALNYSKESEHEKVVKLLLSYGAIEGEVVAKARP